MHVLPSSVIRAWEASAFAEGLPRAKLMTEAVEGCVAEIVQRWPDPGRVLVLAGKGHNGSDALAVGSRLRQIGWTITTVMSESSTHRSDPPLPEIREEADRALVWPARPLGGIPDRTLIIDGILGVGASGPARGAARDLLLWIKAQARGSAVRIALDGPSGLDLDTGEYDEATLRADFTLALGTLKPGLLLDAAHPVVGRLLGIPLPSLNAYPLPVSEPTGETWFGLEEAQLLARHAPVHAFKHRCGQLGILAGSPGMSGAAVLAANAAVEAGCGLVRLWTRFAASDPLPGLLPEVMRVEDPTLLLRQRSSALLMGPGLGHDEDLARLMDEFLPNITVPTLLDADALNLLALHPELWGRIGFPFVMTPHSGELQRLLGRSYPERKEAAFVATERFHGTLVLKGPQTLVTAREASLTWNGSGNPGMARGGMGDVLSGVIATLLAQGYPPLEAARLGVFWHGRAGDLAAQQTREQTVHAGQVSRLLGQAARGIWQF
ncbi:MAG: bifunctional ADP-dependent NAD(P)H-hydrate dehydratase/NAD(P)H-hydrate epimerase [Candidatus Methylacidiphilales bacterium]